MFVVYSPEGQSFIGASQSVPPLKVEPIRRSSAAGEEPQDLFSLDAGADFQQSQYQANSVALSAYKGKQKNRTRRVVVKVSEIMSTPVKTIFSESTVEEAWRLMQEHKIEHFPVLHLDNLVGICSQRDLLKRVIVGDSGALEGAKRETVADVMSAQVVTTVADTDIRQVAKVLTQYEIGALVVMNVFQQPIGIVTRGDIIKRLANAPPLELYV
ncbi:MAG: CBS domain-containing protein [Thiomicrorhabdus sp.]|nr:CBS domain-containing protein [Thiomicrorhabdus sp.]